MKKPLNAQFASGFRRIGKIFFYGILMMLAVFYIKYIHTPVYRFQEGKPFSGKALYNPYGGMNPDHWRKGNFQVHARAWGGLTAGSRNSNEEIHSIYRNLGYELIATSDYQRINRYGEKESNYIPTYEHGYSLRKTHQVLLGANRVLWKDYPLFQTKHHKQFIINLLRRDCDLVYLAHPRLRGGYSLQDMQTLTNYDGIEVLNNYPTSLEHWDAALSAGNYVTLLANDDAHDISVHDDIGHHCTLINAAQASRTKVVEALKQGNALGAKIWRPEGEAMEDKISRTKVLPKLIKAEVNGLSFSLEVDSLAREIRFYGQQGELRGRALDTREASYLFTESDTYIRAEIEFWNKITYYLNPVCRYDGTAPARLPVPQIDRTLSQVFTASGYLLLGIAVLSFYLIRKRIKGKQ